MTRRTAAWAIALILSLHLLSAGVYSVVVPLGEAPDEVDHYAYVRHLMIDGSLPQGPTVTQGKHPPLYYLLAAAAAGRAEPGFDFLRANPDFALDSQTGSPNLLIHTSLEQFPYRDGALVIHIARLLSAILSTVTVWAIYRLARDVFPDRASFALAAGGFVAFVPGFVFISGAVNNDNLAAALSALGLMMGVRLVRAGNTVRRIVSLGLLLGLGLLAKVGTLAIWPAAAFGLVYAELRTGTDQGDSLPSTNSSLAGTGLRLLGWCGLMFGIALAVAAPWLIRNWRLYGDPLGWSLVRATVDLRTTPLGWPELVWLVRGWFTTFWGRFGGAVHIYLPKPAYLALGALSVLSILGLARSAYKVRASGAAGKTEERRTRMAIIALLWLALGGAIVSVVRYSAIGLGTDQARLLYPALSSIAVLFVAGLAGWVPPSRWGGLAGAISGAGLVFCVLAVLLVRQIYAPPEPASEALQEGIDRSVATTFGDTLTLAGYDLAESRIEPGGSLRFSLYWRAAAPIDEDLRSEVWLLAPDGGLVVSWKRSPTGGRFSTDLWPVGPVFVDYYALPLPDWIGPGGYTLLVGVREFPSEAWLAPAGAGDAPQHMLAIVRVPD